MSRHADDGDGRCALTELPIDMCSGCRGHADAAVDLLLREGGHGDGALTAPDSHAFTAKYHGECSAWYGCRILPGDSIIATRAGSWKHEPSCPGGKR